MSIGQDVEDVLEESVALPSLSEMPETVREANEYRAWGWDQTYLEDTLVRRKFFLDHPASEVPSASLPVFSPSLAGVTREYHTAGEFTLFVKLDPCQTWQAHLVRKAVIGGMPSVANGGAEAVVSALFEAKITGARTRTLAVDGVVAAARIAGWVSWC